MIEKLFWDVEMPITMVSAQMQQCGIVLNKNKIKDIERRSRELVVRSRAGIEVLLGKEINLASGPEKLQLLYGTIGYPIQKNQGGDLEYVADTKMIKRLLRTQPKKKQWRDGLGEKVLKLMIDHSRAAKILSTYTHSLLDLMTSDGRLHGSFDALRPLSGRVSSSAPNMQNLPTDTDLDVRDAMEAPEGFTFTIADYKAIEMRIMAALSQDPNMVRAVTDPLLDIHKFTAHHAYKTPYDPHNNIDDITAEQRKAAKGVGFGIAYGRSPFELAVDLGIPLEEAVKLIQDGFYAAYPKVKQLFEVAEQFARHRGYATTHLGRRRVFCNGPMPDAYTLAVQKRISRKAATALLATWMRQTRNHFAQGGAADIVKAAMVRVYNELPAIDVEAMISAQVHDEILTMHRIEHTVAVQEMMRRQMQVVLRNIPLDIELHTHNTLTKDDEKRKHV
jgi:DNA polymerase-1